MGLIRKATTKLAMFIKSPNRLEKLATTADFHKKCEYYQQDIQFLFDREVFTLKNGSVIIHKDYEGRCREVEIKYKLK